MVVMLNSNDDAINLNKIEEIYSLLLKRKIFVFALSQHCVTRFCIKKRMIFVIAITLFNIIQY